MIETITALLVCEGPCSEPQLRVTSHVFEKRVLSGGFVGSPSAQLIYRCEQCGALRVWGCVKRDVLVKEPTLIKPDDGEDHPA